MRVRLRITQTDCGCDLRFDPDDDNRFIHEEECREYDEEAPNAAVDIVTLEVTESTYIGGIWADEVFIEVLRFED